MILTNCQIRMRGSVILNKAFSRDPLRFDPAWFRVCLFANKTSLDVSEGKVVLPSPSEFGPPHDRRKHKK